MSGRHPSYGEMAERLGRFVYELMEQRDSPPWPAVIVLVLPILFLGISVVTMGLPGLALVGIMVWLASARLTNNPPMRIGAVCLGMTAGLLSFHLFFMATDWGQRSASFSMGFLVFFGVLPAGAAAWAVAWFNPEVQADRRNTYYIDASELTPEEQRIVAKRTNGTGRRQRFRPSLIGDAGGLTAEDLREIFEDEAADLEKRARAAEAENALTAAEIERARLQALDAHVRRRGGGQALEA